MQQPCNLNSVDVFKNVQADASVDNIVWTIGF